ncbi:MAG TPA: hypothetical protein VE978_18840 [Chitinophagales bacterium]|nr:hypothetical protein [Chitinophagales bacterium]
MKKNVGIVLIAVCCILVIIFYFSVYQNYEIQKYGVIVPVKVISTDRGYGRNVSSRFTFEYREKSYSLNYSNQGVYPGEMVELRYLSESDQFAFPSNYLSDLVIVVYLMLILMGAIFYFARQLRNPGIRKTKTGV